MSHATLASQPAGERAQVFVLEGEFDMSSAPRFVEAVDDALDSGRPDLIVDLTDVSFLDSTMLQAIIRAYDRAGARASRFALIRPQPSVWRVFVLTSLSTILPSYEGLDDALASFG
jgi:anti-sigma B factor antagonist